MKTIGESISSICTFLINKAADRVIAIGPLVWQPSNGRSAKRWYFVAGSIRDVHCDQITVKDGERAGRQNQPNPAADRARRQRAKSLKLLEAVYNRTPPLFVRTIRTLRTVSYTAHKSDE